MPGRPFSDRFPRQRSNRPLNHDLGCKTVLEVIGHFIHLNDRRLVDAGCGDLSLARQLAGQGARVLAIDPDPEQAAQNRLQSLPPEITFTECGAEAIPAPAASMDGVIFCYSLHHIPAARYRRVFRELNRVVRPGGCVLVIEPAACPLYDQVLKRFHNEDRQRAAARRAILEIARPWFAEHASASWHSWVQYDSFDQFVSHYANRSFNADYAESDIRRADVQSAFLQAGGARHRFRVERRVDFLGDLRTTPRTDDNHP